MDATQKAALMAAMTVTANVVAGLPTTVSWIESKAVSAKSSKYVARFEDSNGVSYTMHGKTLNGIIAGEYPGASVSAQEIKDGKIASLEVTFGNQEEFWLSDSGHTVSGNAVLTISPVGEISLAF